MMNPLAPLNALMPRLKKVSQKIAVLAFYGLGLSAFLFFKTQPILADPVSSLDFTLVSSDTLSLQWDNQTTNSYQSVLSTVPGFSITLASAVTAADQNTTNYFNLTPNTSHTFLVKISTDADDNYLAVSTYTHSKSPGINGFQVFTTSAILFLVNNENPLTSTTTYRAQVSTDSFAAIAFSSQGVNESGAAAPTLTIFGLQPNSTYQIGTDALNFNNLPSSRTVIASTSTLAAVPGSFTALSPSDVGISSITVSWDANGNPLTPPTSYQVQISTDTNFGIFTASETFATTASTTGLTANKQYYFRVRAYARGGESSAFNNAASTFTLSPSPGENGFQMFTTSVTVFLKNNGNPQGSTATYRVQISTDGFNSIAFSSQGVNESGAAAPTLTVSGLQPNSTYQVGTDVIGFSNLPSTRTVVASTATSAATPGAFAVFSGVNVGTDSITAIWSTNGNPLTPPTSYQVQVSTDINFGVFTDSETFITSMSTAGLTGNTSAYFRVRAFERLSGTTPFNSTISTHTLASPPQSPVSLTQTASSLQIQWQSNNSTTTSIEISSSTDNFSLAISTPVPFSLNFTETTTTFINLRENTSYSFRLRAINNNNLISDFSTSLTTKTLNIHPEGISNLAFDAAFGTNDGEIRWTWTAPGGDEQAAGIDIVSYIVRYATFDITAAEFESPLVSTFTQSWNPVPKGNVEARTVTGLNPGTTYFFAIKGVDAVGNIGQWSTNGGVNGNRSYFAKDLALSAPTNPQFSLITSSSVFLSWTLPSAPADVDDRDLYRIYQATYNFSAIGQPFVAQSTQTSHPTANVNVTGLANQTTYYFRVTAVDQGDQGNGIFSEAIESSLSAATATVTTDKIAPSAISDLTALTGASEGEIFLEWTSPGDDGINNNLPFGSFFEIKYSSLGVITNAGYSSPPSPSFTKLISTQTSPQSSHGTLISGLLSSATYWFAIKTIDESNNSAVWNSSADVATVNVFLSTISQKDVVPPSTITGLSLTPAYQKMSLSWISPGDNALAGDLTGFFKIKYGTANITNSAEFDTAASTVTFSTTTAPGVTISTEIVNLSNNLTYYFSVAAIDDDGNESTFSAGEVQNDFPRNGAPGAFNITSPVDNFVTTSVPQNVIWSASIDPDSSEGDTVAYFLEYSTRSDFSSEALTTEGAGAATNKNIAGTLIEDSTTYVRIRASDDDGANTFTSVQTLRINTANTLPSTFSLLIPQVSSSINTLTPTLDWEDSFDQDPGDGLTYTLNYSLNSSADGGTTVSNLTTSFHTVSALTENSTYFWKVQAVSTNPFTGTDTIQGNATFSFTVNSVDESPNPFTLLSPATDQRLLTTLPTFTWQEATDNDPGNTISYTLSVQNSINAIAFSTTIPNISTTSHTMTTALPDNNPYTWSVVAKSIEDNLTRIAIPTAGRLAKVDTVKELPATVTISTPANLSIVSSTAPTLQWSAVTDPDNEVDHSSLDRVKYIVKIGEASDYSDALGQQIFFSDGSGFQTQKQFALKDQTTYFWQVAAAGFQPIGPGGTHVHVDTGALAGCNTIVGGGANECYSVSTQFSFIVSLTNTPPTSVTLNSPSNVSILTTNLPSFDWSDSVETDPAQNITYTLQISTEADFATTVVNLEGILSSSHTLTSPLLQNRTFHWRILTQDQFSDGSPAGNPIVSAQTFSFSIPVLTTPKEPTGVLSSLSGDKNSFTLTWSAVTQNTNGTAITDLTGYNVYRNDSTTGLGTGSVFVTLSSNTVSYVDATVAGVKYFYTLRSFNSSFLSGNSSGTISINSSVVASSPDSSVMVVPNDPELQGKFEIEIPDNIKSVLNKTQNSFGEDLKFDLQKTNADGLKDAFLGVRVKIKTAESDKEISNFSFDKPIRMSFPFSNLLAPQGAPAHAGAVSAPEEIAVFWYNGVEWLNLNGAVDSSNNTIFVKTRAVGEFATRKVLKATQFEVFSITPKKIFTPNGDGCNDIITFQFQNPKGISGIEGKIFDIHGSFIADMKTPATIGTVSFSASCPQPNLADDSLIWDGKDNDGGLTKKGIYIYQIEVEGKAINGTVVVAR